MGWKPNYADDSKVKKYLAIESADDDDFVALWNAAASRNVDEQCGRQFGKVDAPVLRTYRRPVWDRRLSKWVYVIDDLHDVTGLLAVDGDGTAVTDLEFEPDNAVADGEPYQRVLSGSCGPLLLTSQYWGWVAVPPSITLGLHLFAARLAFRRGAPSGVAGSPADGSEVRMLARLDPDMITVLKPYRRTWWAR